MNKGISAFPTKAARPKPHTVVPDTRWLQTALQLADRLKPWLPRWWNRGLPHRAGYGKSGVSIVILRRGYPSGAVADCLSHLRRTMTDVGEPFEILVTPASVSGFNATLGSALREAFFDWVYLLDPGMRPDSQTIREALLWREPQVFAVASRILDSEATGWNDVGLEGDILVPFEAPPGEDGLTRGHLFADSRASLFRRATLRRVLARSEPYLAARGNEIEWGIRAWRMGYEVLFAPHSRVWQASKPVATVPAERRRDQMQVDLRNARTEVSSDHMVEMALQGSRKIHAPLWSRRNAVRVFWSRLRAHASPVREVPWGRLREKYYPTPRDQKDRRPLLLVVSPYALGRPAHGGAHRLEHLLRQAAREYRLVLLGDEAQMYSQASTERLAYFEAVHLVQRPREIGSADPPRVARIRSHSHAALSNELRRILRVYRPDLVQVEFIELAALAAERGGRAPWILTLHDVLLSGLASPSAEDAFERKWMSRFNLLVACCAEDAALLHDLPTGSPTAVVPNGAVVNRVSYQPSRGLLDLLFIGPFRYQPNWDGIRSFLRHVYPALSLRFPKMRLHILGGVDAPRIARSCPEFDQPGVCVHDHTDDVRPWLEACALTINPIRNNRGSCLKLIESLAAGRVCLSTREGARGFLDQGLKGLVVVEAVEDFSDPLTELLSTEESRLNLEAPDFEKLKDYSWQHSAELQSALYRRLLD